MSPERSREAWHPRSWRELPAAQQPPWPDETEVDGVLKHLSPLPPLVFAGEARRLTQALAQAARGEAFVLQAGDCAESFADLSADSIRDKLKVILQMAVVLTYGSGVPVVKVGRMAGQFAKPRSAAHRARGRDGAARRSGATSSTTRRPTAEARTADPNRMVAAYHQSATTLNLLRAFTKGGFADLSEVHAWNQQFVASSAQGRRYEAVAGEIDRALRFMRACGIDLEAEASLHQVDFWTCHEALLLGYEEALTRRGLAHRGLVRLLGPHALGGRADRDSPTGPTSSCCRGCTTRSASRSAPRRAVGDVARAVRAPRPRAYARAGSPSSSRLGAAKVEQTLPPLLRAVADAGHPVVWVCDPMHGNTFVSDGGRKTRRFDDVLAEIQGFFAAHRAEGTWPGGVHVELTGDDVTECLGGAEEVLEDDLDLRYTTTCDPRLNARQSLDLAYRVAELLRT